MIVPKAGLYEDDVMMAVLEAGAEEVNDLGDGVEVVSEAGDMVPVRKALQGTPASTDRPRRASCRRYEVQLEGEGAEARSSG